MVFVLVASLVSGFIIADIAARFVPGLFADSVATPVSAQATVSTMSQQTYDLQTITSAHLFGVETIPPGKVVRPTQTRLPLQLFGIIAGTNKQFARVLIGLESKLPKSYTIGQTVRGTDARVHAIESGRVVLQRGAALEQLDLERPKLAKRNSGTIPPKHISEAHKASAPPVNQSLDERKRQAAQAEVDQRRFRFF